MKKESEIEMLHWIEKKERGEEMRSIEPVGKKQFFSPQFHDYYWQLSFRELAFEQA